MAQIDHIKDIAKYGLENDRERLLKSLSEFVDFYKDSKKTNLALQLQSLIKDSQRKTGYLTKVGSDHYFNNQNEKEVNDLVIDKLTSDYRLNNLVVDDIVKTELTHFIKENKSVELLRQYDLPVSNKLLLHGPSGCGKTLASYVIAGELAKPMFVVNLGAIVSSKLGETSKNLSKVFKKAAQEESIIFIDEFDSLGKVRDYNQDHGEMKRVVNTILQLFDYLPQSSIVIAATNQENMIDDALTRRFDVNLKFELPTKFQIRELIDLTLKKGNFSVSSKATLNKIIDQSGGLSYYSIQKTLINAIKRTLFKQLDDKKVGQKIDMKIWSELIAQEKKALKK
ncbi:ATP-binding protein [Psychroflexus gondwanensis]|uniref:AAA family ATPase n=1 Tax=Psychroflexus gondwanensis TaxID=251 RepID=UPI0011BF87AD|nr:ATP-binding protein [Psychroflexus gondwanensis]TXE16333.1 ATP-binding protein [Psychroflexus gondwanensis]